jgi:HK97 family phage major capsid protein
MLKLHELQETRAAAVAEMRALSDKAETEKRDLTADEDKTFNTLKITIGDLDKKIGRAQTLAEMERRADAEPIDGERGGTPDLSRYSVARALRCAAAGRIDGIEGEVHTDLSRGREMRGNIMVPTAVLLGERRTGQLVGDSTKGGYAVATQVAAVADRFRPALRVESMGATVLRNLTGFLDLPKLASSGATTWIGETQAATRTDADFAAVSMGPKTIAAEYEMSRRYMIQTGTAVEDLLRRDLGFLLAQGLDAAAIKSSGAPTEPTGILDSGIEKVTTEASFSDTNANLIGALDLDDVTGTRAFLTNPNVMKAARKIKDGEGRLIPIPMLFHNERVETTTQVPSNIGAGGNKNALIYGMWSELIIGYWSAVDILLNPYHSDVASKGGALLHAFLDADVAVRHVEAFAYAEIA